MGRSGYTDEFNTWDLIKWRGMVASAIRGRRGQALLRELLAALDAMPEKSLIAEELDTEEGEVCTLAVVGKARGIDLSSLDPYEWDVLGKVFNIAPCMAQEIMYENDDVGPREETPEQRWKRMREWVAERIKGETC